jgi:putative transposase
LRTGTLPLPFQFLAAWVGVWVARHQTKQIEYLKAVNRALMDRVRKKRLRFTEAERRKLAVLGKKLGRSRVRSAMSPRSSAQPRRRAWA